MGDATTPPPSDAALDVAAVAAEARAYLDGVCVCPSYAAWSPGCARLDCPRHGENAPRLDTLARHLVALAARVTAAEAAHAALAGAVREERRAEAARSRASVPLLSVADALGVFVDFAECRPTPAMTASRAATEAHATARRATNALLSGAPAGVVRADVVRAYLAVEDEWRTAVGVYLPGESIERYVERRDAERRRVRELRTALDAALAAVKETR